MGSQTLFHWVGGATWYLDAPGVRIGCDPCLAPQGSVLDFGFFRSRRLDSPTVLPGDLEKVDLWLITHGHQDHLDDLGLARISSSAKVVCPRELKRKLEAFNPLLLSKDQPKTALSWGNLSVSLERVPMVHGVFPLAAWVAGGGNGYYVQIRHLYYSLDVYVTGDTVVTPELVRFFRDKNVDLMVANVGRAKAGNALPWKALGRLTMGFDDCWNLARLVEARQVVPVHFGSFDHYSENDYPDYDLPASVRLALPGKVLELD